MWSTTPSIRISAARWPSRPSSSAARTPEEQERLRERLFREARSAGMLSHPGIVTVYDVEQQGDLAYIAMEYVDGPTLDQLLSDRPPIAAEKLFSVLAQTAAALDYAHQKGIVHRDIKPANIMIAQDGTAKVTDFGIAKITTSDQFTLTGTIVGTPHYMSPEQVQGHPVEGRADQFSLAVIAYEALTGEKPYTGEHLTTVVYKIVTEEPAAPHRSEPHASAPPSTPFWPRPWPRNRTPATVPARSSSTRWRSPARQTKGWKLMARGGSLNEPTLAEAGAGAHGRRPRRPGDACRSPVRPRRLGDTTVTSAREGGRKSGLLTFLLATLVAGGLLALIGFQAAPWLGAPAPGSQTARRNPSRHSLRRGAGIRATLAGRRAFRRPSSAPPPHRRPIRPPSGAAGRSADRRPVVPARFRPAAPSPEAAQPAPKKAQSAASDKPSAAGSGGPGSPTARPGRWKKQPSRHHHQQSRGRHRHLGRPRRRRVPHALHPGRPARPPLHSRGLAWLPGGAPRSGCRVEPARNAGHCAAGPRRNAPAHQRALRRRGSGGWPVNGEDDAGTDRAGSRQLPHHGGARRPPGQPGSAGAEWHQLSENPSRPVICVFPQEGDGIHFR